MLDRFTNQDLIILNPSVTDKKELFKCMTEHLVQKGYIDNQRRFYKALIRREQAGNTEILPHIAIPHAGCSSVDRLFLLILISKEGIDYQNPQLDPVNIVFLFGCDDQHNRNYLRLLAKSARLLKDKYFTDKLIAATSVYQVLDVVRQFDKEDEKEEPEEYFLLLFTLFKTHKLPDLLSAMMEIGIHNAAVIKATSMARRVAYEIPVFAGLSMQSKKKSLESTVVTATVTDQKIVQRLVSILKEQDLDLSEQGAGYIQLFPTKLIAGNVVELS